MKIATFALVALMAVPAFADQIRLFGFVNVDQHSSSTTSDGEGNVDVSTYSWESSFVIGFNETTKEQVVARVAGCDWGNFGRHRQTILLRIAKDSHKYSSSWSAHTFTLQLPSKMACEKLQNQLKRVRYDNQVLLETDVNSESFNLAK